LFAQQKHKWTTCKLKILERRDYQSIMNLLKIYSDICTYCIGISYQVNRDRIAYIYICNFCFEPIKKKTSLCSSDTGFNHMSVSFSLYFNKIQYQFELHQLNNSKHLFTSKNLNYGPSPLGLSNPPITEPTWFKVKVPVLSLQIVVAEPMVSQADSLRTCIIVRKCFNAKYRKLLQKLQEYWRK